MARRDATIAAEQRAAREGAPSEGCSAGGSGRSLPCVTVERRTAGTRRTRLVPRCTGRRRRVEWDATSARAESLHRAKRPRTPLRRADKHGELARKHTIGFLGHTLADEFLDHADERAALSHMQEPGSKRTQVPAMHSEK